MIYPSQVMPKTLEDTLFKLSQNEVKIVFPKTIEELIEYWPDQDLVYTSLSIVRNRNLSSVSFCGLSSIANFAQENLGMDFLTEDAHKMGALPFLWRQTENKIEVMGFVCPRSRTATEDITERILKILLNPEYMEKFLEANTGWRTTFQSLDENSNIKEDQKARSLRRLPLKEMGF